MHEPLHILAISGSLRAASSNSAVLQALTTLAPPGVTITLYEQLADLPYFNPDLEDETGTLPRSVQALRTQIRHVDGILISSPEYAHGVPGVLKNALDWLVSSVEFPGKSVALINISPRSTYVQASLTEILATMSALLIVDSAFTIPIPRNRLNVTEMLGDPQITQALQRAIAAFVQAVLRRKSEEGHR